MLRLRQLGRHLQVSHFSHLLIIALVKFKNCYYQLPDRLRFCAETGEPPLPHRKPHLLIHYQSSQCSEVLWPSTQLFGGKSGKDKSAKDIEMGETLVKNWIFTPEKFRFIVCS